MALTSTLLGRAISTEKQYIRYTTSDPSNVTAVRLRVYVVGIGQVATLEHVPDFGTTDTYTFEIASNAKNFFQHQFFKLDGSTFEQRKAMVSMVAQEVIGTDVQPTENKQFVLINNFAFDEFEIFDFNEAQFDCGDAGSASSKLLTSAPSTIVLSPDARPHLAALRVSFSGTPGNFVPKQEWVQEFYDQNGTLLHTSYKDADLTERQYLEIPPPSGGKLDISVLPVGTYPGAVKVIAWVRDKASPNTQRSEKRTFWYSEQCRNNATLVWLNEYGVEDTHTFDGYLKRAIKGQSEQYRKSRPVNYEPTSVGSLTYSSMFNYEYEVADRGSEAQTQWLSRMLRNNRAALLIGGQKGDPLEWGLLYSWYALNAGVAGNGRSAGGIVNLTQPNWVVPANTDFNTLVAFLGGSSVAGGKLKQTGFEQWNAPNTGATNETLFNAVGGGGRASSGAFSGRKGLANFWSGTENTGFPPNVLGEYLQLNNNSAGTVQAPALASTGFSVRLVRPAVSGENDGDYLTSAYTGSNGIIYDAVVIGTQVWLTSNLRETIYNNGNAIPNVTNQATWEGLTTGAFCVYDNEPVLLDKPARLHPIEIITTEQEDANELDRATLFSLKFRLANERKGIQ